MDLISELHKRISAICPISGLSISKKDNKETWAINFKGNATQEQKTSALNIIHNFSYEDFTHNQEIVNDIEGLEAQISNRRLREAILGLDQDWLRKINNQIDNLRETLK